jgi:hypothetical protein
LISELKSLIGGKPVLYYPEGRIYTAPPYSIHLDSLDSSRTLVSVNERGEWEVKWNGKIDTLSTVVVAFNERGSRNAARYREEEEERKGQQKK